MPPWRGANGPSHAMQAVPEVIAVALVVNLGLVEANLDVAAVVEEAVGSVSGRWVQGCQHASSESH